MVVVARHIDASARQNSPALRHCAIQLTNIDVGETVRGSAFSERWPMLSIISTTASSRRPCGLVLRVSVKHGFPHPSMSAKMSLARTRNRLIRSKNDNRRPLKESYVLTQHPTALQSPISGPSTALCLIARNGYSRIEINNVIASSTIAEALA